MADEKDIISQEQTSSKYEKAKIVTRNIDTLLHSEDLFKVSRKHLADKIEAVAENSDLALKHLAKQAA